MIDQTKLPAKLEYVKYNKYQDVAKAIKRLVVRGAPAIGVAAAFGLCLAAYQSKAGNTIELLSDMETAYTRLKATRPTAVNLVWALDLVMKKARAGKTVDKIRKGILDYSLKIARDDVNTNKKLGKIGAELISDREVILTHCNAGSLATVAYGTALGVIRAARESGKEVRVIATETRPVMQGSRLTAFELKHDGIDVRLIPDTAVGYVMSQKMVSRVLVGADRVLRTGHVFNKIGTYQVAVMANRHKIPFYVAAPISTFDLESDIRDIIIEERDTKEILKVGNKVVAPEGVGVLNPAFDITPPELIAGIITEKCILEPPYKNSIQKNIGVDR
ncbi:MAG: S-methyl-5-thioribose-1-phosphate isomerase [Thermoproteota archaeon]|nr:S-methyl-5-thioribose-1-phosphate isomerase [Thermoproteota archaeon]